jgi:hypothetical protein
MPMSGALSPSKSHLEVFIKAAVKPFYGLMSQRPPKETLWTI